MNHCHDCNSDYTTPGTCNCFAPGGKRYAAPAPTLAPPALPPNPWPVVPVWTPAPWWGVTPPFWAPSRIYCDALPASHAGRIDGVPS